MAPLVRVLPHFGTHKAGRVLLPSPPCLWLAGLAQLGGVASVGACGQLGAVAGAQAAGARTCGAVKNHLMLCASHSGFLVTLFPSRGISHCSPTTLTDLCLAADLG